MFVIMIFLQEVDGTIEEDNANPREKQRIKDYALSEFIFGCNIALSVVKSPFF